MGQCEIGSWTGGRWSEFDFIRKGQELTISISREKREGSRRMKTSEW